MKRFLPLLSLLMLMQAGASAQSLRYGITGAMNVSNYAIEVGGVSYDPESRIGFKAGFRMELDASFITEGFYFDMEALLSSRGAKIEQVVEGNYMSNTFRPYYLEIPIHIGYRYDISNNFGIFASFGPYFGIGLFGKNKFFDGTTTTKVDAFSDDNLKRFDFGLGLKGGVQLFDHYRIFIGYDWGVLDIAKGFDEGTANSRNFYVGASYMF